MLRPVSAVLRDHAFQVALAAGAALTLLVVAAGRWRRFPNSVWPAAAATIVGLLVTGRAPTMLLLALVLLGVGGRLTARGRRFVQVGAAAPGALLVAFAVTGHPASWMRIAVGVVTAALSPLMVEFDRRHPQVSNLLVAVSAVGILGTTPDTEHARALAGGSLGAAPLSLVRRAVPSVVGATTFAGLMTWTAATDGFGRPGAVVGALACTGVFALTPVVTRVRPSPARLVAVHLGLVAVASRVAGFEDGAGPALLIVAAVFVIGAAALGRSTRRNRDRRRPAQPP
jgi:hypothetical protein